MILLLKFVLLSLLIGIIVSAVRFFMIPGIENTCRALDYSSKAKGQLLGYATSTPELVIVISSAIAGVFDVGFWNIASSNIINWILFLFAVFLYRQYRDLKKKTFIDELSFGVLSVIIPLILNSYKINDSIFLAISLLILFFIYKKLDLIFNRKVSFQGDTGSKNGLFTGILKLILGIIIIVVVGRFLGKITEELVVELGISTWIVGWILGFVSSIPEMSGFFEIYRKHKMNGTLQGVDGTQEALDTLVASNMSNLGIILPIGMIIVVLL